MNVTNVRRLIEFHTLQILESHPFPLKARRGRMTRPEIALYLHNLGYIFSETPKHLEAASKEARARGDLSLAGYLETKIPEERGHEKWAENDLAAHFSDLKHLELKITAEAEVLMQEVRRMLLADPANYLFYMTFVEYFTVLAAPRFLQDLERECRIDRRMMTAVLNHQVSDQAHIEEDFRVLGSLERIEPGAAEEAMDYYAKLTSDFLASCLTNP